MLANFRKGFSGDYGVKMKLAKFQRFCKLKWPAFNAGWPAEGTLDLAPAAAVPGEVEALQAWGTT
jgi:hypothetical protein